MFLCLGCIGDDYLGKSLAGEGALSAGTCALCAQDVEVVAAEELTDLFEAVASAYQAPVAGESGVPLGAALRSDWGLFTSVGDSRLADVLGDILESSDGATRLVADSPASTSGSVREWEEFKDEILKRNRFFPEVVPNLERLGGLLGFVLVDQPQVSSVWYRARVVRSSGPYAIRDMGAPPPVRAAHGRANPAGIPYLYLASSAETALSETRPHPGEDVCVARFLIKEGARVVDLSNPRGRLSPFMFQEEDLVSLVRGDLRFLEHLGEELALPIVPREAAIKYVSSQYLCEYIKSLGFDGVLYKSSMSEDVNLALFFPHLASPERNAVDVHRVKSVRVATESPPPGA